MNSKLEKRLFKRFKKFFCPEKGLKASLMAFGFECGDGWNKLLWGLCEKIEKTSLPDKFEVIQVKEKYGFLRFYCNYETDEIQKLISEAMKQSRRTCEECGKAGSYRNDGWVRTLCDKCYKQE